MQDDAASFRFFDKRKLEQLKEDEAKKHTDKKDATLLKNVERGSKGVPRGLEALDTKSVEKGVVSRVCEGDPRVHYLRVLDVLLAGVNWHAQRFYHLCETLTWKEVLIGVRQGGTYGYGGCVGTNSIGGDF